MIPDPFPTREIPRTRPMPAARPAGYLPPIPPRTAEAPFIRPVPPAQRPARRLTPPEPEPATDALFELLPPETRGRDRRSGRDRRDRTETDPETETETETRGLLERYGPAIFVLGAFAFVVVMIALIATRLT